MILGRLSQYLIGIAVIITSIFLFALHERRVGRDNYQQEIDNAKAQYHAATRKVTVQVVTKYVHDKEIVYEKGNTIIKHVPVYITSQDDNSCTINNGFVRLWNSANSLSVPGTSSSTDAAPSSIVLSDIAAQHAREAGICIGTETQLRSLQGWIRSIQEIK